MALNEDTLILMRSLLSLNVKVPETVLIHFGLMKPCVDKDVSQHRIR